MQDGVRTCGPVSCCRNSYAVSSTLPCLSTRLLGTNACSSAGLVFRGVWFTLIEAYQELPPSDEVERAISSTPLKRVSCQTAYSLPLLRSTAISGMPPSARIGRPVSGSNAPRSRLAATTVDVLDQVTPLSVDLMMLMLSPRWLSEFLWTKNSSKMLIRSPFGNTTIWLPMVPLNSLRP